MKFKKKTLSSGIRIIVVPMPRSFTTTVFVLTETGSKYETKRTSGISHFLEHICFKGTKRRPSSRAISEELDGLGANYNAFTGHEYTGYYAKAEARHFKRILDVVSDIYLNSTFPKQEIEKERGVIIGEIDMYEDTPQRAVGDLFTDLLYGDQPAGWDIAGTKSTVRSITRGDLVNYKRKHYVASATVVVIAGKFNEKKIWHDISDAFSDVSRSRKAGKKKVREVQSRPRVKVKYKKTNQTHLIVGVRSHDIFHKSTATLAVLAGILGKGMSSRLFHRIREEMGAGYYVGADNDSFTDHGFLACFAGVDNRRVHEVVGAIVDELRHLKDEKVSEEELGKVKNYLTGNLLSGLETSDALASFYGASEVLKTKLKTPEERTEEIRRVTVKKIQNIAEDIFQNKGLNLALIGPFRDTKEFTPILKI